MSLITCPHCGKEIDDSVGTFAGLDQADLGFIKCSFCGEFHCKCDDHGNYPCPPPCPSCPEKK